MFQRFHEMKERNEAGFTLIELLVVILIIAILAAIAIPVFLRQREKGWIAQSQSALKNAATAAESYSTSNNGGYTGMTPALLVTEGFNTPPNVVVTVPAGSLSASAYCLQAVHSLLGTNAWATSHYSSGVGQPQTGACP